MIGWDGGDRTTASLARADRCHVRPLRLLVVMACVAAVVALVGACGAGGHQPAGSGSHTARPTASTPSTSRSAERPLPLPLGTDRTYRLRSGGLLRSYVVHAPARRSSALLPVLLVFHGLGNTAKQIEAQSDLDSEADRRGFLVVYPNDAGDGSWNEGTGLSSAAVANVDDVGFVRNLITALSRTFPIDSRRIAALGFSDGALLAQLLGCRLGGLLSAVVPVEGTLLSRVATSCHPHAAVSVLEIHGTADQTIPYSGGRVGTGTSSVLLFSAPASIAKWASLDGCSTSPSNTRKTDIATLTAYSGCATGSAVELLTVRGGTHQWPAVPGLAVDAMIAAFVQQHPNS